MGHPDFPAFLLFAMGLAVLVGVGEALRAWGGMKAGHTRHFVHAGVGIFVAGTPYAFDRPDLVYALAMISVAVNVAARRRGWFRGIHGAARQSLGTVAFPLALLPALLVCWTLDEARVFALQTAFLILALADPLAALVGTRYGRSRGIAGKSIAGSMAFGGAALLVTLGVLFGLQGAARIAWTVGEVVACAFVAAGVTTAVEALGRRGWDNFFIVQAAVIVLVVFDEQPEARLLLVVAVGVGVVFGAVTYLLRVLDGSGALAGGLLAASVLGLGGWAWAVPSLTFFVLSSMLSRVGRKRKVEVEAVSEKGSRRDAWQVYANGGTGWLLLLIYTLHPVDVLYGGFLGAFAAAAADTWGTEIGALSGAAPRLITTGRRVPRGTSGAVSGLGTAGALGGALAVALSAWPFLAGRGGYAAVAGAVLAVVLGGVLGAVIDSLAGATVQAGFLDPRTGHETERSTSAAGAHPLVRGYAWLRNDQVNVLCTLFGAAFAMACFAAVNFAF